MYDMERVYSFSPEDMGFQSDISSSDDQHPPSEADDRIEAVQAVEKLYREGYVRDNPPRNF